MGAMVGAGAVGDWGPTVGEWAVGDWGPTVGVVAVEEEPGLMVGAGIERAVVAAASAPAVGVSVPLT